MLTPDIEELFAKTLSEDYDDHAAWDAVCILHTLGTREIFEKAAQWCNSDSPLVRARGADILAQLGKTSEHPHNSFPEDSFTVLAALAQRESEPLPLTSAVAALGHLENPSAHALIASFHSHSNSDVRWHVASALGCFPNEPLSVSTLLKLMEDEDGDVRDWATFGLAVLGDCDSEQIRTALIRRLNDTDDDAREEAMVALAKRKDLRVLPCLLVFLEQENTTDRVIEAACWLLEMKDEREDWHGLGYSAALRARFASSLN